MKTEPTVKYFIYGLVIILSVIILMLILISPPTFTEAKSVYQGF